MNRKDQTIVGSIKTVLLEKFIILFQQEIQELECFYLNQVVCEGGIYDKYEGATDWKGFNFIEASFSMMKQKFRKILEGKKCTSQQQTGISFVSMPGLDTLERNVVVKNVFVLYFAGLFIIFYRRVYFFIPEKLIIYSVGGAKRFLGVNIYKLRTRDWISALYQSQQHITERLLGATD